MSQDEEEFSYFILILYLFTHPGICALPPLPVVRSRRLGNDNFVENSSVTFTASKIYDGFVAFNIIQVSAL